MQTTETISLNQKIDRLREKLRGMESVIVAFSAGVDSTFMAVMANNVLGARALAVTATSPAFPDRELKEACELASSLGLHHRVIHTNELANPNYANNPASRCFHCKTELYGLLRKIADAEGYRHIVDGTNADDLNDFRPGRKAAQDNCVESLLQEIGFTKEEIRQASRDMGLKTADKPAFACLSSRFPYGVPITVEGLAAVEKAENGLRDLGFTNLRVRVHGDIARLELPPDEIARVFSNGAREKIVSLLKSCGYRYVTVDLQGYRRGSLNEVFKALS